MSLESQLKSILPRSLRKLLVGLRLRRDMKKSKGKSRQEVFSEIYQLNLWGGEAGLYSSGSGSSEAVIASYIELISALVRRYQIRTVVDLGCGDFQVGRYVAKLGVTYIGCDIFPDIIERNTATFGSENVRFQLIDGVADALPDGDMCIVRQVFQHLPNADISIILAKLRNYRIAVVTDEQVNGDDAAFNLDMPAFHGTRRVFGGGLKLERAPFFQENTVLLNHPSGERYGSKTDTYLRTVLLVNT